MTPLPGVQENRLIAEAQRFRRAGNLARAEELLRRATKATPGDPHAWLLLSSVQMSRFDSEGARRTLRRAIRRHPREPQLHHNLAMALRREARFDEAHRAIDAALSLRSDDPISLGLKADMLATEGRFEEASAMLAPVIAGEIRHVALASSAARVLNHLDRRREAIELLERVLALPGHPQIAIRTARAHLARLYDSEGEYDSAFEAARVANEIRGSEGFDPERFAAGVDAMLESWSRERAGALPRAREKSELPIFIVGMPRSGTSLVEQILASHPRVHGAGELAAVGEALGGLGGEVRGGLRLACSTSALTAPRVDRAGREILRTLRKLGGGAARVTDKMPTNFLHLGPIALFCPGARVIHCRRNPLDTALSCFMHQFGGNVCFAQDLGHLGAFYRQYDRIMRHWREVLDLPILDVPYEALVSDQEGWSRRLVEFTGLEWDDACLRFHETERVTMTASNEQVRQPVYRTSVGKSKHYEAHLGSLSEALGELADEGGESP